MPQAAPVIAAVGAAATVVGTGLSYMEQKKAAEAQEDQQEEATKRSRRQAIRQAQIARAQTIASSIASGAQTSSAANNAVSSIGSQLGEQLGYSTQMSALSSNISQASARANMWGSVASLGGTAFRTAGGFDSIGNLQGTPKTSGVDLNKQYMNLGSQYGASGYGTGWG